MSHDDIRKVRSSDISPLSAAKDLRLKLLANNKCKVVPDDGTTTDLAGLVIKHSFWTWPDKNIAGNAIDYFVKVEGMTFNQAMQIITAAGHCDTTGREFRQTTEGVWRNLKHSTVTVRQDLR